VIALTRARGRSSRYDELLRDAGAVLIDHMGRVVAHQLGLEMQQRSCSCRAGLGTRGVAGFNKIGAERHLQQRAGVTDAVGPRSRRVD